MGPQRGNAQAIVENICLWPVLRSPWPQACACAHEPSTATWPKKMGTQEADLAVWVRRGTLPAAGPGTYLWPWYHSSLLGKEYLLSQQSHGCLSLSSLSPLLLSLFFSQFLSLTHKF